MDSMAQSKAPSPREPLLERSPAAARAGGPASVTSRRRRITGERGGRKERPKAAEGRRRAGGRAAPAGRGGAGARPFPRDVRGSIGKSRGVSGAAQPRGWVRGWWCGRTAVPGAGAETRRGKRGSSGRGELPSARPLARRALPAPERPGVSRGRDDLGVYVFKCPQDHERPPRAAPPRVFSSSTLTPETKVFVLIVHGGD